MRIIDELEPVGRGLYGGTVGYFGRGGDMDQAITIRSMVFGGGRYSYQAGAGIVADSRPDREHDEVIAKSAVMRRALETRGGRTVSTRLLLIDNYDSFTYNLVQAFLVLGADVRVHRNDRIGLDEAEALEPTHLCISPGPGTPADSGISMRHDRALHGPHSRARRVPRAPGDRRGFRRRCRARARLMHGKASSVRP